MSSNLRYYNQIKPPTKFQIISTPSYQDSILGAIVPVPFSYKNGVLDINLQDNVYADFINTVSAPVDYSDYKVKEMGGTGLVTSIGPNLVKYLNTYLPPPVPPGPSGPYTYEVTNGGLVTKIQYTLDKNVISSGNFAGKSNTFAVTTDAPTGDQFVYGFPQNNYQTVWAFKNPVTIKATGSNGIVYVTLYSTFSYTP